MKACPAKAGGDTNGSEASLMTLDFKSLDRKRIATLHAREAEAFAAARPKSRALLERARGVMPDGVPMAWMAGLIDHQPMFAASGQGAHFSDVDGHRYLDMNHADMSMSCGFAPESVVAAVAAQVARGSQFLLPNEDAIIVSDLLAARFGLPFWQYTLSASGANTEAIRLARLFTGRDRVLMFDGGYHGHIDDTFEAAMPKTSGDGRTVTVQFNDLAAVEAALRAGNIACIIAETAITNLNLILPDPDFHAGLRRLASSHGALLILDETHTHVCAFGGLTSAWDLDPDVLVLGKAIAGGIPMGSYGLSAALGDFMSAHLAHEHWPEDSPGGLATGGTLYGNALSMAAARAVLENILTEDGHARTARLGTRLADGIERSVTAAGLPWRAHRLFCRSGVCYAPEAPRNAIEASAAADFQLNRLHRLFLANRGIWEAISTAGPAVSFAAEATDVDRYLEVFDDLVGALTA